MFQTVQNPFQVGLLNGVGYQTEKKIEVCLLTQLRVTRSSVSLFGTRVFHDALALWAITLLYVVHFFRHSYLTFFACPSFPAFNTLSPS